MILSLNNKIENKEQPIKYEIVYNIDLMRAHNKTKQVFCVFAKCMQILYKLID